MLGWSLFDRGVNPHDLSRQLVTSRTNSWSLPVGTDYPTYRVAVLASRVL